MRQFLTLTLILTSFTTFAQVFFKVELMPDQVTYQVSLRSDMTWNAPLNTVSTAQVSLTVPTGGFVVSNVQSINGLWSNNANVTAPPENPDTDYIIFGLQGATNAITFSAGQEVPLFTFENSGTCTGALELLNNDTDPFFPPNSQNVNVGNQISVIGAGVGVNAYAGNIDVGMADCLNPGSGGGGSDPVGNPSDEGQDAGLCADITIEAVYEQSPSMCGVADGSIQIVATSPVFTLQYSVDGGDNWQADPLFPGLAAGDFFEILVRDVAGICTEEWGILELDAPLAAVIISQTTQNPTCGASDGAIDIVAQSENNEPIEFSIDNGQTWQASGSFAGLAPGNYRAYVRNLTTGCETFINEYVLTEDCSGSGDCLIDFHLEKIGDVFQVSLTPHATYTFPNNFMSSAQMTFKVPTGNFTAGNIQSQFPNVVWAVNSTYRAPDEAPDYDYISIGLSSGATSDVPFMDGQKVVLYTFENVGDCTGGDVVFMDNENDPFFPPNSQNANVGQQITVAGGGADIPVCIDMVGVPDCPLGPCDVSIVGVTPTDPTGCMTADGSISVNATATLSLEYSIDDGATWQTDPVFNDLPAGDYNIKVRAGLGCEAAFSGNPVHLVAPDNFEIITPTPDQVSCGGENVAVSIEVNEMIMAFNVEGTGDFSDTTIDGNVAMFEAVPTGDTSFFSVEIMSMSGCMATDEFVLVVKSLPQTTFSAPVDGCKDEEIEMQYLGNAGPDATLLWTLDGGQMISQSPANTTRPESATIRVKWADAGQKNIQLTVESDGCVASAGSLVLINDLETNISENIQDATGCGSPTGSIDLTLDGVGTWTFNWSGNNFSSTNEDISGLVPGDYSVTITHAGNGCSETRTYSVGGNTTPPDVNDVTLIQPDCGGTPGSIALNNPPANATFDWSADNGAILPDASSVSNLAPGTYSVTVTDLDSGCTASAQFEIADVEVPVVQIAQTVNIDCAGKTGAVAFTVPGSIVFDYELTLNGLSEATGQINGGDTLVLDDLSVGNYELTVFHPQNGCSDKATFPIFSTNNINVIAVGVPPSGCNIHDAEINLEIGGNNPPFFIQSSVGVLPQDTILSTGIITGLYDETVQITITDSVGCMLNVEVPLAEVTMPQLSPDSLIVTDAKCPDDLNAGIKAANGVSAYMVLDSTGQLVGMTPVTGLAPGMYTVISQTGDCTAMVPVEVLGPEPWSVTVETIPASCANNDGAIFVSASGANGGLTYAWSNGVTGTDTLLNVPGDAFFDLTITDSSGCMYELMDIMADSDCSTNNPCVPFFGQDQISLLPADSTQTVVCLPNVVNLTGYLQFLDGALYQPPLGDCSDGTQSIALPSEPGTYLFLAMEVTTGCKDSVLITLLDDGVPDMDTIWTEVVKTQTKEICLDASELTTVPDTLYNMCENNGTSNAAIAFLSNPILEKDLCLEISGRVEGTDQFCMVLCDQNGVCDTTIVVVTVLPRELVIYDGFSPNGDGLNDVLTIKNIEYYPNNHLRIFGRWGNEVYEKQGYRNDQGWAGTFEGYDLPDGTYFYMLDDGEGHQFSGYIQIQR